MSDILIGVLSYGVLGIGVAFVAVMVIKILMEYGVGCQCKRCQHYQYYGTVDTLGLLEGHDCSLEKREYFFRYDVKCPFFEKRRRNQ